MEHNNHILMQTSIANAIRHNNEGVRLLQAGDYVNGMKSLVESMTNIRPAIQQASDITHQHHGEIGRNNNIMSRGRIYTDRKLCQIHTTKSDEGRSSSSYFYAYATTIYSFVEVDDPTGYIHACHGIVRVIFFNMGLIHHLRSIYEKRDILTRKALYFYEQAYRIQMSAEGRTRIDWTMAMAIHNNMALLNLDLGQRAGANRCWRSLLEMIMYLNDTSTTSTDRTIRGEDLFRFMGNVSHLVLRNSFAASAA